MSYFLAKTEPGTYSIDDLAREKKTTWDGVTNPQAVAAIKRMHSGDKVFIYHSGGISAVVGLAIVLSEPKARPQEPKIGGRGAGISQAIWNRRRPSRR